MSNKERLPVDKIDYWKDWMGIHLKATKDGEQVGRTVILQNELEVMIYIKDNFILPN